jgi:hypothetical protein
MPKVSWSAFMDRYPAAHLIAGVIPEDEALPANARRQLALMARLIAWLAPKGVSVRSWSIGKTARPRSTAARRHA